MTTTAQAASILVFFLLGLGGAAFGQQSGRVRIRAQQLVEETVARHPELHGLELALVSDSGCATVAATAPEDVGERCDADEEGPIRTGRADIETPTRADPVYDITQALHDASGAVIGAVGMDIAPRRGEAQTAVLRRALSILRELEAQVPSRQVLLQVAPPIKSPPPAPSS
jgi:iron complex outermembrane receptor protein